MSTVKLVRADVANGTAKVANEVLERIGVKAGSTVEVVGISKVLRLKIEGGLAANGEVHLNGRNIERLRLTEGTSVIVRKTAV